jgi:hypothetical protein
VQVESPDGTGYATVTVGFNVSEYTELHPVDVGDVAAAVRDLLVDRGYTVPPFAAPVTSSAELDWPQED